MNIYKKAYLTCFNSITDEIELMEARISELKKIQIDVECQIINSSDYSLRKHKEPETSNKVND